MHLLLGKCFVANAEKRSNDNKPESEFDLKEHLRKFTRVALSSKLLTFSRENWVI